MLSQNSLEVDYIGKYILWLYLDANELYMWLKGNEVNNREVEPGVALN